MLCSCEFGFNTVLTCLSIFVRSSDIRRRPCFLFVVCVHSHLSGLAWPSPSPAFLAHCSNMRNMSDSNFKLFCIFPHDRMSSRVFYFLPSYLLPPLASYTTPSENRQANPTTEKITAATTTANSGLPCVFSYCFLVVSNVTF